MELELNRTRLTGYDIVLDTELFQEETLETIVPDACPDVLRLVDTQGTVLLKSKTAMDGRVTLTGTARLTVLYVPETGDGLRCLEVGIPFNADAEGREIKSGCVVAASAWVAGADTRTINPRKIMTRVQVALRVQVFSESALSLCAGISAQEGSVEQLTQTHSMCRVAAVVEKPFSFEDDLTILVGRPEAEELLGSRVEPSAVEAKLIGSKLIVKGEAAVQLLYRPVGGGVDAASLVLPVSQIMEVNGVGEEASAAVELCLLDAAFTLGGDGRTVAASLSMAAQAVVRETRNVQLLADAYSTCCQLQVERAPFEYELCQSETIARQTLRECVESGLAIRSVADVYCQIGRTTLERQADTMRLSAQAGVTALCVTEEGEQAAISRVFEVSCGIDLPEECGCRFHCRCAGLMAAPTADGVEVRASFEFPYLAVKRVQTWAVRDVGIGACAEEDTAPRPSVILRTMGDGEALWDVAKRYGAAIDDIVRASELENEQPCQGTLLLIPGKR